MSDDTDPDDIEDGTASPLSEGDKGEADLGTDAPSDREEPDPGDDAGRVLSPGELDITDDEAVEELEDGRFVVSPGGGPPNVPEDASVDNESTAWQRDRDPGTGSPAGPRTDPAAGEAAGGGIQSPEAARNLLSEELGRTRGRYAVDVVGRFDGEPARHRTVSNDVVATFENLLVWYARHVTDDTPVDEVLEILIREASVVPEPDTPNLAELLEANGLTPEDSIAELVDAIADEQRRG